MDTMDIKGINKENILYKTKYLMEIGFERKDTYNVCYRFY